MRQSLIKKYHQGSSSSNSFDDSPNAAPSFWKIASSGLVGLLIPEKSFPGNMAYLLQSQLKILRGNETFMRRMSTHFVVILLIAVAIGVSKAPLAWDGVRAIQPLKPALVEPAAPPVTTVEKGAPLTLPAQLKRTENGVLIRGAVSRTIIPDRSKAEISTYVVQSGDTIYDIAAMYGLAPETIMWSNPDLEDNPDLLQVGHKLTILPVDGVYHQVGGSDTIDSVASTYKADPQAIIDFPLNEIDPETLTIKVGQWLVVPGGSKPFVPRAVTAYTGPIPVDATVGTGAFSWPASGTLSQGYWSAHRGIDIAAWVGAPIGAADSGYVVAAGWDDTGYGYSVVIDHSNGFQTLYAHLQAYYVDVGDNVAKGQQIGEMGCSGNCTGPHLHFEVRQGTVQRNPIGFLP